ncbi:hypothetical protein MSAN_01514800 [Mycena sanguinolenta]|uniref:Uncharacterized protein n=1 Tax=Mycena sanguinolenta TaxID=230812 RepID=A0A8H6Y7H9_9AGAR|nr:hypothetical protein MSAN_01514800 [Mycena sanguinolenta]
MNLQPLSTPESNVMSTTNNTDSAAYAGAFFPQATGFNICGGVFTSNVTKNVYNPLPEPTAFRTVLLGDVNLIKEYKEMRSSPQSSLGGRRTPGASVRRVYTAKIEGHASGHMTVTMYEGDGAEEAWNQHLANYEAVWHPNIMQLYGLLIIETTEFEEAASYIFDVFCKPLIDYFNPPVWIRSVTGGLCLDLAQGEPKTRIKLPPLRDAHVLRLENVSLDAPDSEDIIILSLSEEQYLKLCSGFPIARSWCFQVPTEHLIGAGIFRLDSQYGTCVRITEPLQILPEAEPHWVYYGEGSGELLPNSWIRLKFEPHLGLSAYEIQSAWLVQASRIFTELQEEAYVENYICVYRVQFILRIADKHHIPEGYLFVCPPRDFRTELHPNLYEWPACPAYWSLDPSGAARLSTDNARILGFPAIHIETTMTGKSWDRSVYSGLRRFHEGKGFNPDSREVARQLGYPLYEGLRNVDSDPPFPAHDVGACHALVSIPVALFGLQALSSPPLQMQTSQRPIQIMHRVQPVFPALLLLLARVKSRRGAKSAGTRMALVAKAGPESSPPLPYYPRVELLHLDDTMATPFDAAAVCSVGPIPMHTQTPCWGAAALPPYSDNFCHFTLLLAYACMILAHGPVLEINLDKAEVVKLLI